MHTYMINLYIITINMHKMVLLQMVPHNTLDNGHGLQSLQIRITPGQLLTQFNRFQVKSRMIDVRK